MPLRHEIRAAAGHLERAPDAGSHHSTLGGRGLLGVHERLRRDLLLVAHVDAQPGVLSVFELVVSFEVRYSWEQAMLLGELIIHCVLILLKLILQINTILLLLICIRNSSILLFRFITSVGPVRHLEARLVSKRAVAVVVVVRGLERGDRLWLRARVGGAAVPKPAASSVLAAWVSSSLGIDHARLGWADSRGAHFVWTGGASPVRRRRGPERLLAGACAVRDGHVLAGCAAGALSAEGHLPGDMSVIGVGVQLDVRGRRRQHRASPGIQATASLQEVSALLA